MNARVLVGVQSGKGVPATSFTQLYAKDYGLSPEASNTKSEALNGSRFFSGKSFLSKLSVGGDIPMEYSADVLLFLLENGGFGEKTDSGGDLTLKTSVSCDKWLTVVCDYVGEGAYEIVTDCKLNTLNLDLNTESFVEGSINVIGCDISFVDTGSFSGTVVQPSEEQLICLDSTITNAGSDISPKLSNAKLTLNNNLQGVASINSVYNVDIIEETAETTMDITYNRFDKAIYKDGLTKLLASTTSEIVVTLGTDDPAKKVIITAHKATPTENSASDLGGQGSMSQSFDLGYDNTNATVFTVLGQGYGTV